MLILLQSARNNLTELAKLLVQLLLRYTGVNVAHIEICLGIEL